MFWIVFLFPLAILIGLVGSCRLYQICLDSFEELTGISLSDWVTVWWSPLDGRWQWWKMRNRQFRKAVHTYRRFLRHVHASDAELLPDELAGITKRVWDLSRVCRMQLSYPKYSEANRLVVAHWLSRNQPDNISNSDWARMCPYIVTMAFVRSAEEVEARRLASMFPMEMDST